MVATVAALGCGLNVTRPLVFGFSPPLAQAPAVQGRLIDLGTIPGAYLGRWILRNTPIRVHKLFLETLILYGAGYFLCKAATPPTMIGTGSQESRPRFDTLILNRNMGFSGIQTSL